MAYIAAQQMLTKLRNLFGPKAPARLPAIPHGERVYAIGDIHGRLDLFEELIRHIESVETEDLLQTNYAAAIHSELVLLQYLFILNQG